MKKLLLSAVVLGFLFASFDASAMVVEPRGFTICQTMDTNLNCTGGNFYNVGDELKLDTSGNTCDWTPNTNCERWYPENTAYVSGYGVNWTCCFDIEDGESWSGVDYNFQYYDPYKTSWNNATWMGYIGAETGATNICTDSDYVFQGKFNIGGSSWTYTDQIARCGARYGNDPYEVVEFWME